MTGLPPLSYNFRSLFVRWSSTLLTTISIGATVAIIAGILSLEQGFSTLFDQGGRSDVAIFLRPGSNSEGDSVFTRDRAEILMKETPEFALDAKGQPLVSAEVFLAVRKRKLDGGETNVPIRGVEPNSLVLAGDRLKIIEGRAPKPGFDEVMVGESLTDRIQGCKLGDTITFNTTPFSVVGVFTYDGPFRSEIWGDLERMSAALNRFGMTRVIARLKPGTDFQALEERMKSDPRVPAKALMEPVYLKNQTAGLSTALFTLSVFLGLIMGTAAVFTGTNTMLSALSSRSHEIGILLALGFRPMAVFFSFMVEALFLGLLGGIAGCLLVLPVNGIKTGTTNFQTFTEVAFAFRVTPQVLLTAVAFAVVLGVLGGLYPAWRAANQDPVTALRKG